MVNQQDQQLYREEPPEDGSFFANIHQDKRVYRGSTYANGRPGAGPQRSPKRVKKRTEPEAANPFSIDLPKPERIPVDLLSHLVEPRPQLHHASESSQTDNFKPRPPEPKFVPKKTGVDAATHIPEGELFKFDTEIEPVLNVLVTKTIEQAVMEVEEELEMQAMTAYKSSWLEDCRIRREEELAEVEAERARMAATERLKRKRIAARESELRKKILCQYASKRYLSGLCSGALESVQADHGLFPAAERRIIAAEFLPWVLTQTTKKLADCKRNDAIVSDLVRTNCMERFTSRKKVLTELEQKQAELDQAELARREEERRYVPPPDPVDEEKPDEEEEAAADE
ncbi:unnamed protein product [Amoebophrya sp. A120]|nr:unnamed protein product [Amoebophrya sp. A120]|eukprot:GSA120T00003871001.1